MSAPQKIADVHCPPTSELHLQEQQRAFAGGYRRTFRQGDDLTRRPGAYTTWRGQSNRPSSLRSGRHIVA